MIKSRLMIASVSGALGASSGVVMTVDGSAGMWM